MRILGILGGVASGKSFVARTLVGWGGVWLNADQAGHQVLRQPDIRDQLVARWGKSIIDETGEISRSAVAAIVFGDTPTAPQELKWLESVSHPRIRQLLESQLSELRRQNVPLAILDAPVMLKSGWDALCDFILFVDCPREIRLQRALTRPGWTEAQFAAREAAQEPLEVKKSRADFSLDNSGTAEYTEQQLRKLWTDWTGFAPL
ncbi:MAG: dephospho-CoA kinase [Pirellulales bacterium]|nr:dephospho-CoA kinase [Pirellulales bacterium]